MFLCPYSGPSYESWVGAYNVSISANNYLAPSVSYSTVDGRATSGVAIDGGVNAIQYYDIDMSLNDIGTYGGPYSWDNYWDASATGKARVYGLEMPFEIWTGQTPTIKADAVHEK